MIILKFVFSISIINILEGMNKVINLIESNKNKLIFKDVIMRYFLEKFLLKLK